MEKFKKNDINGFVQWLDDSLMRVVLTHLPTHQEFVFMGTETEVDEQLNEWEESMTND